MIFCPGDEGGDRHPLDRGRTGSPATGPGGSRRGWSTPVVGGSLAAVGATAEASQTGRRSTMQRRRSPLSTPRRAIRGVRLRARRAPKPVGVGATPGCQPKMERRPACSCFVRQGRKQQASGRLHARTACALEQPTPRTAPVRQASGPLSRGVSFGCPRSPASDRFRGGTVRRARAGLDLQRHCKRHGDRACGRTDRARSALVAGRPGPGDQDGAFSGRSRASGS